MLAVSPSRLHSALQIKIMHSSVKLTEFPSIRFTKFTQAQGCGQFMSLLTFGSIHVAVLRCGFSLPHTSISTSISISLPPSPPIPSNKTHRSRNRRQRTLHVDRRPPLSAHGNRSHPRKCSQNSCAEGCTSTGLGLVVYSTEREGLQYESR